MGYTHYWSTKRCDERDVLGFQQALPTIRDILKRHQRLLCLEYNEPHRKPLLTGTEIQLNGKGKHGHETFLFRLNGEWEFCKTARKPYDIAVCEVLLVLKAFLPGLEISSDGFAGYLAEQEKAVSLDGVWNQAIAGVQQYGIHYRVEITKRRTPYCDLAPVLNGVAVPAQAGA